MSEDTARVTTTRTVKVESPAPGARRRRAAQRLRRMGEAIRRGWRRFTGWTKRSTINGWARTKKVGSLSALWIKKGARGTGRFFRRTGNRLYWSGAAVGRGMGRTARFLGRSAATLGRGTSRFLARTTGWTVRSASWLVRTVLESVFLVSLAATLVLGLITAGLAFTHDKYEQKVHNHARAWANGEYREGRWSGVFGPMPAQSVTGEYANEFANRVGPWEATEAHPDEEIREDIEPVQEPGDIVMTETTTTEVPVPSEDLGPVREDLTTLTVGDIEYQLPMSLYAHHNQHNPQIGPDNDPVMPYGTDEQMVSNILKYMGLVHTVSKFGGGTFLKMPGYEPTADQLFRGYSYWSGRVECFDEYIGTVIDSPNWVTETMTPVEFVAHLEQELKETLTWKIKGMKEAGDFANREMHETSYRRGYKDQMIWFAETAKIRIDLDENGVAHRDYVTGQPIQAV